MHWHIQRAAKESLRYISEHYSTVRNRKKDIWKSVCGCDECICKDTHICTPTYILLFWAACSTAVIQCLFLPTHFRLSYNSAGLRLQRGNNNELELVFTNFSQFEMRVQFVLVNGATARLFWQIVFCAVFAVKGPAALGSVVAMAGYACSVTVFRWVVCA